MTTRIAAYAASSSPRGHLPEHVARRVRVGAEQAVAEPAEAVLGDDVVEPGDDLEQVLEHEQVDERADDRADLVAQDRADAEPERAPQARADRRRR